MRHATGNRFGGIYSGKALTAQLSKPGSPVRVPIKTLFRFPFCRLLIVFVMVTLWSISVLANPPQVQLQSFGPGTQFPLPIGTSIVLDISLVHDAGTSIVVTFSLSNNDGELIQLGSPQTFTTFGNATASVFIPSQCFSPGTGWRVYAAAQGQVNFTTSSYLPNLTEASVSIQQNPPQMAFEPISTGNTLTISSQANATQDQTNLTINETIYFWVLPANIGCATSSGYTLQIDLDGVLDSTPITIPGGYELTDIDLAVAGSGIGAGSHTITFSILDPSNTSVASTSKPFFLASPPAIQTQPSGLTVLVGNSAIFTIAASATPAPSYQWEFNGATISGASSSSYTISDAQLSNAGNYSCTVANYAGNLTSTTAALQVNVPTQPTIAAFTIPSTGNAQMTVNGQTGTTDIIESSPDLVHWTPVTAYTTSSPTSKIAFPTLPNANKAFYRIRLQN